MPRERRSLSQWMRSQKTSELIGRKLPTSKLAGKRCFYRDCSQERPRAGLDSFPGSGDAQPEQTGQRVFWKPRRASVRMLCSCARTGTQPFSRIPLRIEEVGRKLYLSETPSIGWEAKTLGAKRRISSSEIATVPGATVSAVLMLVDLVSWFCEPQQRGEALGAAGVFSTFGFGRKSMLGIFCEPKAKR
jgi:hypothetical protein